MFDGMYIYARFFPVFAINEELDELPKVFTLT